MDASGQIKQLRELIDWYKRYEAREKEIRAEEERHDQERFKAFQHLLDMRLPEAAGRLEENDEYGRELLEERRKAQHDQGDIRWKVGPLLGQLKATRFEAVNQVCEVAELIERWDGVSSAAEFLEEHSVHARPQDPGVYQVAIPQFVKWGRLDQAVAAAHQGMDQASAEIVGRCLADTLLKAEESDRLLAFAYQRLEQQPGDATLLSICDQAIAKKADVKERQRKLERERKEEEEARNKRGAKEREERIRIQVEETRIRAEETRKARRRRPWRAVAYGIGAGVVLGLLDLFLVMDTAPSLVRFAAIGPVGTVLWAFVSAFLPGAGDRYGPEGCTSWIIYGVLTNLMTYLIVGSAVGSGQGPIPIELIVGAVISCTSVSLVWALAMLWKA